MKRKMSGSEDSTEYTKHIKNLWDKAYTSIRPHDIHYFCMKASDIQRYSLNFEVPQCQRTLDSSLIGERIDKNLEEYNNTGNTLCFYEIHAAVKGQNDIHNMHIIDGQHRMMVLQKLLSEYNIDTEFMLVVKIFPEDVAEKTLWEYFRHMNNTSMIHPETCFFTSSDKDEINEAGTVLHQEGVLVNAAGNNYPHRPYINQRLLCILFRELTKELGISNSFIESLVELNKKIRDCCDNEIKYAGMKNPDRVEEICNEKLNGWFIGLLRPNQEKTWKCFMN